MKLRTQRGWVTATKWLLVACFSAVLMGCGGSSSDPEMDPDIIDLDPDPMDPDIPNPPPVPGDNDGDGFVDVTATTPCGGEMGEDNNSSDETWSNNCWLKRQLDGGQFADSLYTLGVQRLLFCNGFGSGTLATFADGEFGPGTKAAVEAYQAARGMTPDGIVGGMTWTQMQMELGSAMIVEGMPNTDAFAVNGLACENQVVFFADFESPTNPAYNNWDLAEPVNGTGRRNFSIDSPF